MASEIPLLDAESVRDSLGGMPHEEFSQSAIKRRYSVTGDVLSYLRCKRQYGFFSRRRYIAAQSGQLFFGTVIHETLDRAHAHFRGEIEGVDMGSIPDRRDIERYFMAAERSLVSQAIRPLSRTSRDQALEYVQRFNATHGEAVYPRIVDTEHRLQKDKGGFILHGVVDVVAQVDSGSSNSLEAWSDCEIWDYKGSKLPRKPSDLVNYEFQMRLYAHLYELRNGVAPRRAVLWFLGEPVDRQTYDVSLGTSAVAKAVEVFEQTVVDIEGSIDADDWSRIRQKAAPAVETCDACDIRWSCPAPAKKYRLRAL